MFITDLLIFIVSFIIGFGIKIFFHKYLWIIPTSIIAGIIALIGSNQVLGLYSFSLNLNNYIDILLAFIFCTFPLTIGELNPKYLVTVKKLWQYSVLQYLTQWGLSFLIISLGFKYIWPYLNDTFGLMLPSGFAGGHGSAALVGDLLVKLGEKNALSLTMTLATIGALSSVIGGIIWIYWAKSKNLIETSELKQDIKFKIPNITITKNNLFTSVLIIGIVFLAALLKPQIILLLKFEIPIFAIAVVISLLIRILPINLNLSKKTVEHITNNSTDILVCIGIAGIKLLVVTQYLYPIISISIIGILICVLYFRFIALKIFKEESFEKAIFTWGWSVGGLVFGLALVKIVNPKHNIKIMEQFALTYLMLAPIEISLLLSMPYLVTKGYALYIGFGLTFLAALIVKTLLKNTDK